MKTLQMSIVCLALSGTFTFGLANEVKTTTEVMSDSDTASRVTTPNPSISASIQEKLNAVQNATAQERVEIINEMKHSFASLSKEEIAVITAELKTKLKQSRQNKDINAKNDSQSMNYEVKETNKADVALHRSNTEVVAASLQAAQNARIVQTAQIGRMQQMQNTASSSNTQVMTSFSGRVTHH